MATSRLTLLALMTTLIFIGSASSEPLSSLIKKPLRIGAFNIQVFGATKFGKSEVVERIVRIIKRYDILLVQEIRDSTEKIIKELHLLVNLELPESERYGLVVSERLGRTSSKEQYAFFYKNYEGKVEVTDEYVFNDAADDVFEREPYVVRFRSKVTALTDFAIIGIHIKPSDAINELNNLEIVYEDLLKRYDNKLKDVIFAGDFNADCSYVGKTKWDKVTFRSDDRFVWLIGDDVDTTVAKSDCAYDRIIIAGEGMAQAYVPGSADVFYFDSAFGLPQDEAVAVSDHYPIEMDLLPKAPQCVSKKSVGTFDDLLTEIEEVERIELLKEMIRGAGTGDEDRMLK
ncbi:deoxyribonuclease-1-like [Amphiura filiformis]|uniref:deoxyribonuclease-1-like n=1 Tax=Amphiura filiformis TaxID=82378 RepID=UPI003B223F7A